MRLSKKYLNDLNTFLKTLDPLNAVDRKEILKNKILNNEIDLSGE